MTKDELLRDLKEILRRYNDREDLKYYEPSAHRDADDALLEFIGDPEIEKAYEAIPKWHE